MSTKKVSYMKLLKEAISEFDTSKNVDVKGPMLDPILSYSGDGELPTFKNVASILERYYFQEDNDKGVSVQEDKLAADDNKIDAIPGKEPKATKKDIKDELVEQELEPEEEEEPAEIEESSTIELENSVIEKLIAEMEDEEIDDEKKKKDEKKPASEANREVGDEGAGTQAAGTGNADDQVPSRKDETNEGKNIKEQEEPEDEDEEEEEEPAKVKDIDKEIGEQVDPSATPGGPSPKKDEDELEEAFAIFKEQIEDEVEDEVEEALKISSDDIQV